MGRKDMMKRQAVVLYMAALLGIGSAAADAPPLQEERPGAGWRRDDSGQLRGTGENFGRGWRTTKDGQLRGTGENFGRGWRPSGDDGWRGTGENFGRGWEPRRR